mmetsp:Transcript_127471/g.271805  ORF Transcript_127471/g.271805 Transcript_127471/m.271805 type:complete len:328 (-) Transcript_127471:124-1107(-)
MGNSNIVQLNIDAPCSEAGKTAVVSEPLPENILVEDLWDGMMEYVKYPVPQYHSAVLKSCTVTPVDGDKEFLVKVILDGQKLDAFGYGKGDGTDRVTTNNRMFCDWDKKEFKTINYKNNCWLGEEVGDDTTYLTAITRVHKPTPPIQYEAYFHFHYENPPRHCSDQTVADISMSIMDPIVQRLAKTTVRVIANADSASGSGKVVMTPELTDVTYDIFFNALIAVLKATSESMGAEIVDTSDKQFKSEFKESKTTGVTDYDVEKGEVTSVSTTNGIVISKWFHNVQRDPLRMEVYMIDSNGVHTADKRIGHQVQMTLNAVLEKSASWW